MKAILLVSISNIPSFDSEIKFLNFTFSSDKSKLENILSNKGLEKGIGGVELEKFKSGCYFHCETELKTESDSEISVEETKTLMDNITIYHNILDSFISFLWFRKDNCCSLNSFYVHLPTAKRLIAKKAMPIFSTNKGIENQSEVFLSEDFLSIASMFVGSSNHFYHKNISLSKNNEKPQDMIIKREIIPYDFKKQTRIERAFNFLLLARRTSQLPLKISFYICIYETLFYGSTNGEISHQIAERVALYSSNTRVFRKSIYKQIKEAYNIRSTYFHGNSFKGFKKDLGEISYYLDNLTRTILYRIFSKDSEIFLQSDELLEKSFIDMLFEDERSPDGLTIESGINHKRFRT
jgi:hypothetical protein